MNYFVRAEWKEGTVGWLIKNTKGKFSYSVERNYTVWLFELGEDAVAFKLKFGI